MRTGCLTITPSAFIFSWTFRLALALHPLLSVIVTECPPADSVVTFEVASPVSHLYVYGGLPPDTFASAIPLFVLTAASVIILADKTKGLGAGIFTEVEAVCPFASVTVTLYR